jgi:hypothetical protein
MYETAQTYMRQRLTCTVPMSNQEQNKRTMMQRIAKSTVGKPKMADAVPSSTSTHTHTAVAVGSLQFIAACHLQWGVCVSTRQTFNAT